MSESRGVGRRAATAGLVAIWLVAGCGGEDTGGAASADTRPADAAAVAAPAGSFDPCTLLTADEVTAALGWAVAGTQPYPAPNGLGHCKYSGAQGNAVLPPEQADAGLGVCFTNFPCSSLPAYQTSAEMADARVAQYPKEGVYADLKPVVKPLEGMGVPAIEHELGGLRTVEMAIGGGTLAYVETWGSPEVTRGLAEKVLARAQAR